LVLASICVVSGSRKRGPSTGVRVSAKREKAPTILLPEQIKLGLAVLAELGRASVDDPRLLASLESQRDQQILAGGIEDEVERSGEAGRGDSAGAFAARENRRSGCTLIAPRFKKCLVVNHSKKWRGRRDSNPRPLP